MQVYGVVEVQLLAFLTLILDGAGNELHGLATLFGESLFSNPL
jgi:hypothetical protein